MKRWPWLVFGFALLFAGSYIDSIRGVLMPVLTQVLGLTYGEASGMLVLGNFSSVLFTFVLLRLTQAYSERAIVVGLCAMGGASAIYTYAVTGFASFLFLSFLFGGIVSTFGGMANLLVIRGTTAANRARVMCGLHTMYGLGCAVSPIVATQSLDRGLSWQFSILFLVPVILLIAGGTWWKLSDKEVKGVQANVSVKWTPIHFVILFTFSVYVAAEVLTSMWMTTYLLEVEKLTLSQTAFYVSIFFALMVGTRLLCFFSLRPQHETAILIFSLSVSFVLFCLGLSGWSWAFAGMGLLGPYFPLFLARLGRVFPEQASALTLWVLAADQLTLAICHLILGKMTDAYGVYSAYTTVGVFLALALGSFLLFIRMEKQVQANSNPIYGQS